MYRRVQPLLVLATVVLVVAGPLVFYQQREYHERNFQVVADGMLYRSGQMTPAGLERVVREYGIRTVVSLRKRHERSDVWEEAFCAARGVRHVRIVPRLWAAGEDGEIPAQEAVRKFLAVMDQPENYPVLIHCLAGIHRTGTMVAIYRMEYQGWSAARALAELAYRGYDAETMEADIASYLQNYVPRRWSNGRFSSNR
jgi:tyrosine-protein phosphatase SIW14